MITEKVRQVFIDPSALGQRQTRQVLDRLPDADQKVLPAKQVFLQLLEKPDPIQAGKEILILTKNQGRFIRPCPGTKNYLCCGYQILHIATGCIMECAYCVLQAYFHPPVLQLFVNTDDLFQELDKVLSDPRSDIKRLGTGEFTDSLIWEDLWDLTPRLVERFAAQEKTTLEIKSKTGEVSGLLNLKHNRKTIIAFSVNTPRIIQQEERNTAPLEKRIQAAMDCQEKGYPLAFHFDPMVWYEGCEEEYEQAVERIFERVQPQNVAWISIGALRFMPDLLPIIKTRFPRSGLPFVEFATGLDGKTRTFKPLRVRLYNRVIKKLREWDKDAPMYFCMEDPDVWKHCLGSAPKNNQGLGAFLNQRAKAVCGIV